MVQIIIKVDEPKTFPMDVSLSDKVGDIMKRIPSPCSPRPRLGTSLPPEPCDQYRLRQVPFLILDGWNLSSNNSNSSRSNADSPVNPGSVWTFVPTAPVEQFLEMLLVQTREPRRHFPPSCTAPLTPLVPSRFPRRLAGPSFGIWLQCAQGARTRSKLRVHDGDPVRWFSVAWEAHLCTCGLLS